MTMINWKNFKKAHTLYKNPNYNVWQVKEGVNRISSGYYVINTSEQPQGAGLTYLINTFGKMPVNNSLIKNHGKGNNHEYAKDVDENAYNTQSNPIENVLQQKNEEMMELEFTNIIVSETHTLFYNPTNKRYVYLQKPFVDMINLENARIYGETEYSPVFFVDKQDSENFVMVMPIRVVGKNKFLQNPEDVKEEI